MFKFIWKVRCFYYFIKYTDYGIKDSWYVASSLAGNFDWQECHPKEAMLEEVSCWS